ncbi:MAG: hypothetical protein MMC23_004317 [Stictis urceolatum]|nr:hypothetical protein [Stictis urceolata]
MKSLDLSYVSEYVSIDRLFNSTSKDLSLTTLHLSRSTVSDAVAARLRLDSEHKITGPHNLKHLRISGNTSNAAATLLLAANPHLDTLSFTNCRFDRFMADQLINQLSPNLKSLEIGPRFAVDGGVDYYFLFERRSNLLHLSITGPELLTLFHNQLQLLMLDKIETALETLTLRNDPAFQEDYGTTSVYEGFHCTDPSLLFDAIGAGPLRYLRKLTFHIAQSLIKNYKDFKRDLVEIAELLEVLEKERAAERADGSAPRETGVWLIDS